MKTCSKCQLSKDENCFAFKSKAANTRTSVCKDCHKIYSKQHYKNNTDKYISKAKERNSVEREKCKQYIIDYLKTHPCVDCGNNDIDVLEFDHIDFVGSKAKRVSHYTGEYNRLIAEIEKCEVRCANCHVKRTRRILGRSRNTIDFHQGLENPLV